MAAIKKGKTLKLDAICAKLKSIGGDDVEAAVRPAVCEPQIPTKHDEVQSELGQLCAKLHSLRETEESENLSLNVSLPENTNDEAIVNGGRNGVGENNNIEVDIKQNTGELLSKEVNDSVVEQDQSKDTSKTGSQNGDLFSGGKEMEKENDIVDYTTPVKVDHSILGDENITPSVSSQDSVSGASRRKRRKAATPRNIAQVREILEQLDSIDDKDELAEYEINNQNTTFPPPDLENGFEEEKDDRNVTDVNDAKNMTFSEDIIESQSDISINSTCSSIKKPTNIPLQTGKVKNSRKQRKPQIRASPVVSVNMPLDLSLSRSDENDEDNDNLDEGDEDEYSCEVEDLSLACERDAYSSPDNSDSNVCGEDLSSSHASTPVPRTESKAGHRENQDISALKDYAENTMNELIQMYGFSGSNAESLTGQVHPDKFMSNQILAHHGSGHNKDKFRYILPKDDKQASPELSNGHLVTGLSENGPSLSTPTKAGIYVNYVNSNSNKTKPNNEVIFSRSEANNIGRQVPKVVAPQILPDSDAHQTGGKNGDKFTNSAAYIKAVFNQQVKGSSAGSHQGKAILPDYSKYLKRFSNGHECQVKYCRDLGYREHFHCMDCNFRVFVKKEEMVRHFKWHRKREESLQHGFLRFSPMDDCSQKFSGCTHNGRQTHYHCLQGGCDKVYISTSDVQMHANYHRKDSAIIQEGFQRFRATEDCGTPSCAFYGQRTTHFHCRRPTCNFTFKNKADMEKHKTYHQKDEILGKDGFKKFMKYEHCGYSHCRYSKVSNHIHCIRPNCNYVLHSTAQLFSHKRKHERRDFENAYRKFREDQHDKTIPQPHGLISGTLGNTIVNPLSNITILNSHAPMSLPLSIKQDLSDSESCDSSRFNDNQNPLTLPLNIKREFEEDDDSESIDSKRFKEDPDTIDDSNVSDERSESSSSLQQEMSDQESLQEDTVDEGRTSTAFIDASPKLVGGDRLSSSLNLPIPNVIAKHAAGVIVTSPQEAVSALASTALPIKASTSLPSTQITTMAVSNPQITTIPLPARPPIMEKKEKDESWKSYLIRYTANDPCNSRCQYLYKDHYHCKVDGCLVLFKSKDGVREHARFHELQDRITPVAYHTFEPLQACPENCQYSLKEKHYHCIWTGCTHVVPHIGPTFGRLEHYRIHEYARASQGKSYKSANKGDDLSPRRRGRPPKYPKISIPVIPKVELTEQEIAESTRKIAVGNNGVPRVINGFKVFEENENCPDELCMYRNKQHYHCARPRCHHATDRLDVLNLHAKDFHNFVNIMEGFEFFDRNVNCRRVHCHNNKANRHFHCVKPKCDYSFVRHSTMFQHDKKHQAVIASKNNHSTVAVKKEIPISPPGFVPIVPALSQTSVDLSSKGMIKTSGTYYPLSGLSKTAHSGIPAKAIQISSVNTHPLMANISPIQSLPLGVSTVAVVSGVGNVVSPIALNTVISSAVASTGKAVTTGAPAGLSAVLAPTAAGSVIAQDGTTVPLTVLLQRGGNSLPQPYWSDLCEKMHITVDQNCGRPFCKLKKKAHYHCYECNLAFSDPTRLRSHVGKHGMKFEDDKGAKSGNKDLKTIGSAPSQAPAVTSDDDLDLPPGGAVSDDNEDEEDELNGSSSLNLEFSTFSNMIAKAQQAHANKPADQLDLSDSLGYGKLVIAEDEPSSMENSDVGNDDSVDNTTEGSDDAKNSSRKSGRKRSAPKHKDFVDTLVIKQRKATGPSPRSSGGKDDSIPDGYIRIKQKEDCGYVKCAYRQGVTHFHCSRSDCGYSFSDRSRLIQHTLRHERIDSLTGGEMRQYRMNQACERPTCEFQGKSSHFHCLKCDYCCTDSSKVLTHRKNHAKMESLSSQGFRKVTVDTDCGVAVCQYSKKHMHYHCTKAGCNVAVLGPSQMTAHKLKHAI